VHVEKFQIVLRVVVMRLCAVQENDVAFLRLSDLSPVFYIEDAFAYI